MMRWGGLNALHPQAHAEPWPDLGELPSRLGPAFEQVQQDLGVRRTAVTGLPKPTLLTPYFKRAGVDGMINPFSLEVLVNATVLSFERPVRSGPRMGSPGRICERVRGELRRLVDLLVWGHGVAIQRLGVSLSTPLAAPRSRLCRPSCGRRWIQGRRPTFARSTSEPRRRCRSSEIAPIVVYDRYLRANRIEDGIASYGAVVDLVLGSSIGEAARSDD